MQTSISIKVKKPVDKVDKQKGFIIYIEAQSQFI